MQLAVAIGRAENVRLGRQHHVVEVLCKHSGCEECHCPQCFLADVGEVMLYAFSTASSNATLPLALETAETKLRLPSESSRFVLTVGSTANQNGTALFEGVTVLFLAQVYGLDLTVGQQVRVMLMSIVAGGSLPMVLIVAQSVGVPAEGMALILGVDRFLDMCRTAVNVTGDLVIAALVGGRVQADARLNRAM